MDPCINQFDKYGYKCRELALQYACMYSLRYIDFYPIAELSVEEQDYLLECTLVNPLYRKRMAHVNYRRGFLKKIMSTLEAAGSDLSEDIYMLYATLVNQSDDLEGGDFYKYYYYTALISGKNVCEVVVAKESQSIVSMGTTGLLTWPAAFRLVEYLIGNRHLVDNKRIVELGSGVGFTGLALMRFLKPCDFVSSDSSPAVLDALQLNIAINGGGGVANGRGGASKHSTLAFDWTEEWSDDTRDALHRCDIVLGADIVYDPVIVEVLVSVVKRILSRAKPPVVIFCLTIRNKDTTDVLFTKLDDEQIKYEISEQDIESLFYYEKNTDIQIIHLSNY